jgi:hypothetical protein
MPPDNQPPVVAEDPSIVRGGPLDPTSPEGTPSEGHQINPGTAPLPPPSSPHFPEPLYRGFTGDITDTEHLKRYTKQLEDLITTAQGNQKPIAPQPNPVNPPAGNITSAKDRYSELIFSKPDEAFEIMMAEADRRSEQKINAQRQHEAYWQRFYEGCQDLKNHKSIVDLVVNSNRSHIATIQFEKDVTEFVSNEARKIVDNVKKETGYTETRIPSQSAASLGGSREPVPQPPKPAPAAPLSLVEQLNQAKAKRSRR